MGDATGVEVRDIRKLNVRTKENIPAAGLMDIKLKYVDHAPNAIKEDITQLTVGRIKSVQNVI